jgi:uncharacterized protein (TIGR02246 family)
MNRALQVISVAAVFVLAACAPAPVPAPAPTSGTAADEAALRALGQKYADAWNKADVATLSSMLTDDYEAVSADGKTVKGRAGAEQMEKESAAQRAGLPLALTVNTSIVKWSGANGAALSGTWTMAGLPAGMGADKGAWSSFAVKGSDGQWRIATGLVAEYVPPPATPPAPKTKK